MLLKTLITIQSCSIDSNEVLYLVDNARRWKFICLYIKNNNNKYTEIMSKIVSFREQIGYQFYKTLFTIGYIAISRML